LKELHEKFRKRTAKQTKQPPLKDKDATSHGDSANFPPMAEFPEIASEVFAEVGCPASEAQDEVPEIPDEEPFVCYDFVNRRYEGDVVGPAAEEMDLDVEDIDKQLDLALVRHKVSVLLSHCADVIMLLEPKDF